MVEVIYLNLLEFQEVSYPLASAYSQRKYWSNLFS